MTDGGRLSNEGVESGEGETASLPGPSKECVRCGADVSAKRRVRLKNGDYVCYSCAAEEMAESGRSALASLCSDCKRLHHPLDLYRWQDQYLCQECADARALGGAGRRRFERPNGGKKIWMRLFWVAVAGWVAVHFLGVFNSEPPPKKVAPKEQVYHTPRA